MVTSRDLRSEYAGLALATVIAIALPAISCRPSAPPPIDPELAACVPADALMVAGVRLDRLRANPRFQQLAAPWLSALEPLRDATDVLLSYNGKDLLIAARGNFRAAPSGAVLLNPTLALAGSPASLRAATAQHTTGRTGTPELLAHAETIAAHPLWAAVRGGIPIALPGNAANLERLFQFTEYATLTADVDTKVELTLNAAGRTPDAARQFEETLRAVLTVAAAGRDPALTTMLQSVQIRREEQSVQAKLTATTERLGKLLGQAAR